MDPITGLNVPWTPHVRLAWFDATCGAICGALYRLEFQWNDGSVHNTRQNADDPYRYHITLQLNLYRTPGPTSPYEAVHVGDWVTPHSVAGGGGALVEWDEWDIFWEKAEGSFTMAENRRLTDFDLVDPGGAPLFGSKQEKSRVESFTLSASCTWTFQLTQRRITTTPYPGSSTCLGETPVVLSSGVQSIVYSEPVGTAMPVTLSHYRRGADYFLMGLELAIPASISFGDPNLDCLWGTPPTCADGFASLSGASWTGATSPWTGDDGDWEGIPPGFDFGNPPAANWRCFPSWALTLDANCCDYQDGSAEATDLDHRCFVYAPGIGTPYWNLKLGQFTSNGGDYRYPASGFCHTAQASVWDGDNPVPPVQVHIHEPLYHPKAGDVPGSGAGFVLTPGHSATAFFAVNPDWAEATGRYPNSQQWPLGKPVTSHAVPRIFPLHMWPAFAQGTLTFAATHRYGHFNLASAWTIQSDAAFLSANPGYSTAAALSTVGGATQAVVTTPNVLARQMIVPWKPFAHRYQTLRVKGSAAGLRLRIGIGDLDYLGAHWYSRYLWEFATTGTDTYASLPFDLLLPEFAGGGTGGAVTRTANANPVHPVTWYPAGASLWVEFLDAGTYTIDYLEGSYNTTGTRTPLMLLWPLDGRGELNPLYTNNETPQALSQVLMQQLKVFANGAHMLTEQYSATLNSWWLQLFEHLDNTPNDTGVTVAVSVDAHNGVGLPHASQFQESLGALPFGKRPAPGVVEGFGGQARAQSCYGYYGMGNPYTLAYGMVNAFRGDWIWNGAVWGNTAGPAATPTLHDNPGGTLLDTQASDDDGYWELHGKYGVTWPYANPRYLTPGPPGSPDLADFGAQQWTTPGGVVTYTTLGQLLNAHWLKPGGLSGTVDGAGYLLAGGPGSPRFEVIILDRAHLPVDFLGQPVSGANPANLEDALGMYHRLFVVGGNIHYRRADQIRPEPGGVFDHSSQLTADQTDSYPRIAKEPWGRLVAVFQRTVGSLSDVWLSTSDDDGQTWHAPTMAIPGGTKPIIRVGLDGTILTAALVGTNLHATRQDPGDLSPSAVYVVKDETGTNIEVADDTFDFDQGRSGDAPWVIVLVKAGGTAPTEFQSWDELKSAIEV